MRGDERMDEMIDAALRSYAEPGEICEPVVALARLRERAREERAGWTRFWAWAIPLTACAVAILLAGLVWALHGPRVPQVAWAPQAPGVVSGIASPTADWGIAGRPANREDIREQGHRATHGLRLAAAPGAEERLPKLEVFPTPRPLSPEEAALAAFATGASPAVKNEVIEGQKHSGDPITIAELKIQSLNEENQEKQLKGKDMQ